MNHPAKHGELILRKRFQEFFPQLFFYNIKTGLFDLGRLRGEKRNSRLLS